METASPQRTASPQNPQRLSLFEEFGGEYGFVSKSDACDESWSVELSSGAADASEAATSTKALTQSRQTNVPSTPSTKGFAIR
jgi:hypothetical protein